MKTTLLLRSNKKVKQIGMKKIKLILFLFGILLFGVNTFGLFKSMRDPNIYTEDNTKKVNDITIKYPDVKIQLKREEGESDKDFAQRITYVVADGMLYYWKGSGYNKDIDDLSKLWDIDGHHVVIRAQVSKEKNEWWMPDASYGIVVPFDISAIEANPEIIRPAYANVGAKYKSNAPNACSTNGIIQYTNAALYVCCVEEKTN